MHDNGRAKDVVRARIESNDRPNAKLVERVSRARARVLVPSPSRTPMEE